MAGKAVKEAPKDVHGVVWWRALPALHQQQLAELWIAVTVVSPPPPRPHHLRQHPGSLSTHSSSQATGT